MTGKKYSSQFAEGEHSEFFFYLGHFKDFSFSFFVSLIAIEIKICLIFLFHLFSEAEKKLAVDQALRDSMKDVVVSQCQIHVWIKVRRHVPQSSFFVSPCNREFQ